MDDSRFQQPPITPPTRSVTPTAQPSPTAQSLDTLLFDRAALLMGRSLYWNTSPRDHIAGIEKLLCWCLALPGARLGVSPIGVAQIIQSVYAASAEQPSIEVVGLLDRFGTSVRSAMHFYPDREIWREHLDSMLGWL